MSGEFRGGGEKVAVFWGGDGFWQLGGTLKSARSKQLSICVHLAVNQSGERSKAVKIDERPMRVAKPTRRDRDDVPVHHRGDGIDRGVSRG